MAIEYNWSVSTLECRPQEGSLTDVVFQAWWAYRGNYINDETEKIDASSIESGVSVFTTSPDDTNFIPYDQLTEQDVIDWIIPLVDLDLLNSKINAAIELQLHPVAVILPLPWNQTTTTTTTTLIVKD
jgi:hypothetical protein